MGGPGSGRRPGSNYDRGFKAFSHTSKLPKGNATYFWIKFREQSKGKAKGKITREGTHR